MARSEWFQLLKFGHFLILLDRPTEFPCDFDCFDLEKEIHFKMSLPALDTCDCHLLPICSEISGLIENTACRST